MKDVMVVGLTQNSINNYACNETLFLMDIEYDGGNEYDEVLKHTR